MLAGSRKTSSPEHSLGLEGISAKDKNSPYIEGPTETWH
jgi:ATP-dependent DNA ligase